MVNKETLFYQEKKEADRSIPNRIVVKIGTTTITEGGNPLNTAFMSDIARQTSKLVYAGRQVPIVSSGAVDLGRKIDSDIPVGSDGDREAALYGQPLLMAEWIKAFKPFNVIAGQCLFTENDLHEGSALLKQSIVRKKRRPCVHIINANDAVNRYEIDRIPESADNDKLAKRIATDIKADLLLLLSDVNGVKDKSGNTIETIRADENIEERVIFTRSSRPSGMKSKCESAQEAARQNIRTVIANGREKNILLRIARGERIGTSFERT